MNDDLLETSSLGDHLEELRQTLIRTLGVILLGTCLAFFFYQPLLKLLTAPLETIPKQNLIILSPIEGFSTVFKICIWMGIAGTSPVWLYFLFQFIAPALHQKEKFLVIPFGILSLFFISLGITFAYQLTIPLANHVLFHFNQGIGINQWSLSSYIDYTILLILANAIAFEFFALLILLVHCRILNAEMMIDKRKHAIVTAFILGAILTPPDIFSQILMALPLIVFYELTILYARIRGSGSETL